MDNLTFHEVYMGNQEVHKGRAGETTHKHIPLKYVAITKVLQR